MLKVSRFDSLHLDQIKRVQFVCDITFIYRQSDLVSDLTIVIPQSRLCCLTYAVRRDLKRDIHFEMDICLYQHATCTCLERSRAVKWSTRIAGEIFKHAPFLQ